MLTLFGKRIDLCDRTPRRDFLAIGSLAMGGLSLPQLLSAEQAAGIRNSQKSVILIYLTGGPPHQDMVDLKPDAPSEIRGDFSPIETNVPGVQISELMPRLAKITDKLAIVRSLVGSDGRHSSFQCVTGRRFASQPQGGSPEIGSVLSKLKPQVDSSIPSALDLSIHMAHLPYNLPGPGFLGKAYAPFKPTGHAMEDTVLQGIDEKRLGDRQTLLARFDELRRKTDEGIGNDTNELTARALQLLTSNKLADALDISKEDPKIRERYGKDDTKVLSYSHLGYQSLTSKFLQARRLVEAGARCVTVAYADFDWHGGNFANGRKVIPLLDQGLSALISDLHERGLDKDVSVVVWGEFGRTPKINKSAGRDHWPNVAFALLAGGGMRTGQVIGATNRYAEEATERPVHFQDVFATLYEQLGIPASTTIPDLTGRPQHLVDNGQPIAELI
ncbi:MAG: hypothetical protein CMJ64_16140 [Planctomycetaceae bacterium]|nr:hypothetical protein [Planctomycetaceae bacterium]